MEEPIATAYTGAGNQNEISNPENEARLHKWQTRLLPFLIGMPTLLIIVFILLATLQVRDFNARLSEGKTSSFIGTVIPNPSDSAFTGDANYVRWVTLLHMEQESIDKRYKQAGFLLISRVLTKYLGFLTGMILVIVGSVFIVGKLSEDKSTVEGSFNAQLKVNIASSSPGIIFGVLGTSLMITAILTNSEIDVRDTPLYLNPNTIQFVSPVRSPDSGRKNVIQGIDPGNLVPEDNH